MTGPNSWLWPKLLQSLERCGRPRQSISWAAVKRRTWHNYWSWDTVGCYTHGCQLVWVDPCWSYNVNPCDIDTIWTFYGKLLQGFKLKFNSSDWFFLTLVAWCSFKKPWEATRTTIDFAECVRCHDLAQMSMATIHRWTSPHILRHLKVIVMPCQSISYRHIFYIHIYIWL